LSNTEVIRNAPIPVLLPLKEYELVPGEPDAIFKNLCDFALRHHFPTTEEEFKNLLCEGRLCVIFDGVDEIRMVQGVAPRDMESVLGQLDLQAFGKSTWIATARTGIFAAVLPRLRQTYRLACLLNWKPGQWRSYVFKCQQLTNVFLDDQKRDDFLMAVEKTPRLLELTATPLLARMLVESWKFVLERTAEVSLISLFGYYTDFILTARAESHPDMLIELADRRRCLECAAEHFFKIGRQSCSPNELVDWSAPELFKVTLPQLDNFVRIELQTYSLLVCDLASDTLSVILGFSHRSFYEYYLARAVVRQVDEHGWEAASLLGERRIDAGEAGFVGARLAESGNRTLARTLYQLLRTDTADLPADLRRNLVHVALAEARAEAHRHDNA
jgi:hypothetical protein